MQFKQLILLVLIYGAVCAHAQNFNYAEVKLKGSCPRISYITNFDIPSVLGFWYRAFSTANLPSRCYENQGQNMFAANFDEKTLSIIICCRSAADKSIAYCGSDIGSGICTITKNPGEIIYSFADQSVTIYVLDAVYDRFVIVYGCNAGKGGRLRDETIFILSRTYTLSGADRERVDKVLKRNGIEFSTAKLVVQGPHIPYTPNSSCQRARPFQFIMN